MNSTVHDIHYMTFSPVSYYFLPLWCKYLPQPPISKTLKLFSFLYARDRHAHTYNSYHVEAEQKITLFKEICRVSINFVEICSFLVIIYFWAYREVISVIFIFIRPLGSNPV